MLKLIPDQITRTVSAPLTQADVSDLTHKKTTQLLILIGSWIIIACICYYTWTTGSAYVDLDKISFRVHFSSENTSTLRKTVPYICAFILLATSFYFVKYLLSSIIPLDKDIDKGKKTLLYYKPVKSSDPDAGKFFLSAPFTKKMQLQISQEDFDMISEKEELCLEIGPRSFHILRLTKEGNPVSFY